VVEVLFVRRRWSIYISIVIFFLSFSGAFAQDFSQKIDMDFYNTDIDDALRVLAAQQGVSILPDKDVSGKVTLHLSNVSFEEGLTMLAQSAGCIVSKEGSLYRIQKVPSYTITFEENLLTLWARSVDIKELLWQISRSTGNTILIDDPLIGFISINIQAMPLDEALQVIAESKGYSLSKSGSIYSIKERKSPTSIKSEVIVEDGLLTLDISGMDIRSALALISTKTGVNIIAEKGITGTVSIFLRDIPLEEALEAFAFANNFALRKEGNVFLFFDPLKNYYVNYYEGLLTLRAQNTDIRTLMTEISLKSGVTILMDKDIFGTISAYLANLDIDAALKKIADSQGLKLIHEEGAYLIKRPQQSSDFSVIVGKDGKMSFDIKGADLSVVLREIADQTDIGLAIYGNTRVNLNNLKVSGVTLGTALELLLKGSPFVVKFTDGIYLIGDAMALRYDTMEFSSTKLIKLENIPVDKVFTLLPASFPSQNLRLLENQNAIIAIGTPQFIAELEEYICIIDLPKPEIIYKLIRIDHVKAGEMLNLLPSYMKKNEMLVLKEQNALMVTGIRSDIEEIEGYIKAVDLPNPQIIFDVLVIEYVDRTAMKAGFSADAKEGKYSIAYNLLSGGSPMVAAFTGAKNSIGDFNLTLNALVQEGKAKVRANPRIAALNGNEASFSVLTRSRYWDPRYAENDKTEEGAIPQGIIRTIDTGIEIKLKPWISGSGDITVEVQPSISDTAGTGNSGLPSTNERSAVTTVRVKDGETIVIGGLIQTIKHEAVSKLPILGDIPIIGYLFRSVDMVESETEFVIYITPYLIPETGLSNVRFSEMIERSIQETPTI
jgi:type II secretory pathway component HofQ